MRFKIHILQGWIDVEVQKIKDEGIITVTYAGTEVSEKAIRHVFEQFYQAEDTPGNLNVVTEIGLSVAKTSSNSTMEQLMFPAKKETAPDSPSHCR